MGFRENLKKELNYRGILVKELASASGVKKRAIDTYLLSEKASIPPADTAVRIAKVLGVSVEYLVTGEELVIPQDIRQIVRRLRQLDQKDRQIIAVLTDALLDREKK